MCKRISMRQYASSPRKEWIREIKGERLQDIAESTSSAPHLASSSAVLLPRRNECLGTPCSLIEQGERRQFLPDLPEIEVKGKMKERKRREVVDLLVLPRQAKSMQDGAGFSRKTRTYWAC